MVDNGSEIVLKAQSKNHSGELVKMPKVFPSHSESTKPLDSREVFNFFSSCSGLCRFLLALQTMTNTCSICEGRDKTEE